MSETPASPTPTDPFGFTTAGHEALRVLGPVPDAVVGPWVERVVAAHGPHPARVLDVGCGKGEWAVRLLDHLAGDGVGVEPNPSFARDARERAHAALGPGRLTIETRCWSDAPPPQGPFTLALCTGSLQAFGRLDETLSALRAILAPHGLALLGTPYWRQVPAPEFLAALGASADHHASLPDTLAAIRGHGWEVLAHEASSTEACDAYERAYANGIRSWCAAHPDAPERAAFERRIGMWSDLVDRWARDTLGYALVLARVIPTTT
ncbi:MAG: class I SAM-dependent methyltransferase [bacterium]